MFEYHPEPWNQWINIGNLSIDRGYHAVLSIGAQDLPCLSGECYNTQSVSDFSPNLEQDVLLCLHRLASFVLELKIATTLVTTAAAESVLTTLHSPVSLTRPLSMESGNYHFVLRKAVAVRVSGLRNVPFLYKLISKGVVTSPNYPANYPLNIEKTNTIRVESGKVLRLKFTHFSVLLSYVAEFGQLSECQHVDYVKITDGDGTTLMDKSCGSSSLYNPSSTNYFHPPTITTRTNTVEIFFKTAGSTSWSGWSFIWTAVTTGTLYLFLNSIKTFDLPQKLLRNIWTTPYQSVALPPLAAPAQTWKLKTANMILLENIAAAANAQIHLGSSSNVSSIQQRVQSCGSQLSQTHKLVLQRAVAAKVRNQILPLTFHIICNIVLLSF